MNREIRSEFSSYTPEELSQLFKKDPKKFEALAAEALDQACIGRTPGQTLKYRQMQWSIDAQLRKARNPSDRMHIMENIFYGRVFGADGELAHLMENCTELVRVAAGGGRGTAGTGGAGTAPGAQSGREVPVLEKKPTLYLVKK